MAISKLNLTSTALAVVMGISLASVTVTASAGGKGKGKGPQAGLSVSTTCSVAGTTLSYDVLIKNDSGDDFVIPDFSGSIQPVYKIKGKNVNNFGTPATLSGEFEPGGFVSIENGSVSLCELVGTSARSADVQVSGTYDGGREFFSSCEDNPDTDGVDESSFDIDMDALTTACSSTRP